MDRSARGVRQFSVRRSNKFTISRKLLEIARLPDGRLPRSPEDSYVVFVHGCIPSDARENSIDDYKSNPPTMKRGKESESLNQGELK
jgi:hypothetical protein